MPASKSSVSALTQKYSQGGGRSEPAGNFRGVRQALCVNCYTSVRLTVNGNKAASKAVIAFDFIYGIAYNITLI
jgi:hypothetical protein